MKEITHINFAKGFRGGERQTYILIEELSKKGYLQKVFVRKNAELFKRLKNIENIEIVELNKPYFLSVGKLKESKLIHAHEAKAAQLAYLANLLFKVPYFITRRVDIKIRNNFFNKLIYKKAERVIALSTAIKERILNLDASIKTTIIPSSYTNFQINTKEVHKIKEKYKDCFLIGNIAALEYSKGQHLLIEAAVKLEKKYPKLKFIFLGKGNDEEEFKEKAKDSSNIVFEGFVDNVGDYVSCLNLFVFPSLSEGLGSILLDVMNFKVPIIASNIGGIPDIITNNKNGILVDVSSDAIYKKIEELYINRELREKLSSNANRTIENYSSSKMLENYLELYSSYL